MVHTSAYRNDLARFLGVVPRKHRCREDYPNLQVLVTVIYTRCLLLPATTARKFQISKGSPKSVFVQTIGGARDDETWQQSPYLQSLRP
jgi:hypothetical protein